MIPINRLLAGYRSYKALYHEKRAELTQRLADEGQRPAILVIACSDSRVDPAILFNADPGEIFVVRNVAALVPPYEPDGSHHGTSSAIEYAVKDLKVEEIIVLGHHKCGGIQAMRSIVSGEVEDNHEFVGTWMNLARDACELHGADDPNSGASVEMATIKLSVKNLKSFPWIQSRIDEGKLRVHGWWFDISNGELYGHDPRTGQFSVVEKLAPLGASA
ncbi:carbonic anhydrase [Pacificispira sp.]|uniref:carbonic anhydrase n=1 Tax=Pacificispira sp. TaxID=2888761 RepID=UPI003BAA6580